MAWNTGSDSPGELEITCQHFRSRSLLLQRLVALARSEIELILQVGSGWVYSWRFMSLGPNIAAAPALNWQSACSTAPSQVRPQTQEIALYRLKRVL